MFPTPHPQPQQTQQDYPWMGDSGDGFYDKVLSRGVSNDDLMNNLQNNPNAGTEVKSEENPEEIKRKYETLLQHQKELESRIQQLVSIIVHEEQPLPQCDLNFNYDEVANMNDQMQRPVKRVKPAPSPMDVSPHTPNQPQPQPPQQHQFQQPQIVQQYRKDAENATQQLIFSQERRQQLQQQNIQQQHLQQQQTESMLANFSPQLAVDPFWQMNFLNTNTPTTLGFLSASHSSGGLSAAVPDEPTPITRKRSNSEPGFGLLQFAQMNNNSNPFNFQQPLHSSNNQSLTPPPQKVTRKRSNSDAVVFVDEISKARDSHAEKQDKNDQKRLVEQQGGYNRDKKKRKYDNMMSFFKFR